MASGIFVPMAGAVAQSQSLDVVANNLANASTAGYRAERPSFQEVLGRTQAPDARYAVVGQTSSDLSQGALRQTDNPLDVAIEGDGFFAVETAAGTRYTRDGQFRLNEQGQLVTKDGYAVLDDGASPITVGGKAGDVEIEEDGGLFVDGKRVGRLAVERFAPGTLAHEGKNLFVANGAPVGGSERNRLVAGAVEQSNVNVVRSVVELIRVSRAYESLHRMIESNREIDERTARGFGNG